MTTTAEPPVETSAPKGIMAMTTEQRREAGRRGAAKRLANMAKAKSGKAADAGPAGSCTTAPLAGTVAPASPAPDEKDEIIKALKAKLDELAPKAVDVESLPRKECWFQFRRNPLVPMEKILRSDDPRWDEFSDNAKWPHVCQGTFAIEALTRDPATGEVVSRKGETVLALLWGPAREAMLREERTGMHYIPLAPADLRKGRD